MIETRQLTKHYGPIRAVDGVSFSVGSGEVLGFLGPNGAGKSTTMKMLAGFVEPTSGQALVFDQDVTSHPIECKRQIGYLPEGAPSYGEMTPHQFLKFIGNVRGMTPRDCEQRIDAVVAQLHLERVLHQSIETLSKGFKRRVGLAQAILHDPRILVLDEPTDGLDPNQKHEVRQLIQAMSADKIIIVSTHILEEVSAVCSRAIIIARGKILADETPADLQARAPQHNRVVLTAQNENASDKLVAALESLPSVSKVSRDANQIVVDPTNGKNLLAEISLVARERNVVLDGIQLQPGQLDDVFRAITLGTEERS
ncbi:MAG: ABC transporter ATP-binding protein [Gammaproteobacteria bacterium]